jgi:hypothetical protein
MLGRSTSARRQDAAEIPVSLASGPVAIFAVRRMDVRFEQRFNIKFSVKLCKKATSPLLPWSLYVRFFSVSATEKKAKRTATWEYQGYSSGCDDGAHRHSERAAFRTCRNAGDSVLTAEGTTSKGTGSISCEVEFCVFYRLSLRTLRTKDVHSVMYPSNGTSDWNRHVCAEYNKFHVVTER